MHDLVDTIETAAKGPLRTKLQVEGRTRDLAMFNLAIATVGFRQFRIVF